MNILQKNRYFTIVKIDLAKGKLVNFRRTSLRKDTYGI